MCAENIEIKTPIPSGMMKHLSSESESILLLLAKNSFPVSPTKRCTFLLLDTFADKSHQLFVQVSPNKHFLAGPEAEDGTATYKGAD